MSDRPLGTNWPNAYYEMKAENERLRAALVPFAQIAEKYTHDGLPPTIAMLDCRRALDLLGKGYEQLTGEGTTK